MMRPGPNAYQLDKEYRRDQEAHSEKMRLIDVTQAKDKQSYAWIPPHIISSLVLVTCTIILLGVFIWVYYIGA